MELEEHVLSRQNLENIDLITLESQVKSLALPGAGKENGGAGSEVFRRSTAGGDLRLPERPRKALAGRAEEKV